MHKQVKNILLLVLVVVLSGCAVNNVYDGENVKRVGQVQWHKESTVDARALAQQAVPNNAISIFFLRDLDADEIQTSANLAVNDRFQVSLQPGNFTQVYSCSGVNDLSAEITRYKNNDLLRGASAYDMAAGGTYYFDVDISNTGRATISNLSPETALARMDNMKYQKHQISRVVPDCAPQPARIELEILFDTDKAIVKNQYYKEIQNVAEYMTKYPQTSVLLEGHTDSRAGEQYNIKLSQRRVNAVAKILHQHYGISSARIQTRGYGETRPRADNQTAAGRQQNRRVMATFSY